MCTYTCLVHVYNLVCIQINLVGYYFSSLVCLVSYYLRDKFWKL